MVNMSYIPMILKYTSPEAVPLSFKLGRRRICGIPEEFSPKVSREFVDSNIGKITVEGKNRSGLTIRADYTEYAAPGYHFFVHLLGFFYHTHLFGLGFCNNGFAFFF